MKHKITILLAFSMLFNVLTTSVYANDTETIISTDFYVSASGNDANDGTDASQPFASIQRAMAATTQSTLNCTIHVLDDITYGDAAYNFSDIKGNITIEGAVGARPTITLTDDLPVYFFQQWGDLIFKNMILDCKNVSDKQIINYTASKDIDDIYSIVLDNVDILSDESNTILYTNEDEDCSSGKGVVGELINSNLLGRVENHIALNLLGKIKADHLTICHGADNYGVRLLNNTEKLSKDSDITIFIECNDDYNDDFTLIDSLSTPKLSDAIEDTSVIKTVQNGISTDFIRYIHENSYKQNNNKVYPSLYVINSSKCELNNVEWFVDNHYYHSTDELLYDEDSNYIGNELTLELTKKNMKKDLELWLEPSVGATITLDGKPVWCVTDACAGKDKADYISNFNFSDMQPKTLTITSQDGKHTKTCILIPKLKEMPNEYTITYCDPSGNELTNLPKAYEDVMTYLYDEDSSLFDLPHDIPYANAGYEFDGWYDQPNGAGNKIYRFDTPGDKKVYAHWTKRKSSSSSSSSSSTSSTSPSSTPSASPKPSASPSPTPSTAPASASLASIDISISDKGALTSKGAEADYSLDVLPEQQNDPASVVFDLSQVEIKDAAHLTLAKKVTLPDGTVKKVNLGGTFDPETKSFVAFVDGEGDYCIEEVADIKKISLQINNPDVTVNGEPISNELMPQIINNTTVVPLRTIAETLGADIKWDNTKKQAIITLDGKTIRVGSAEGAVFINNRTLVPIRYIAEAFGARVIWVPSTKSIEITK